MYYHVVLKEDSGECMSNYNSSIQCLQGHLVGVSVVE